ncbi:oligosaccharide flippase family protein [Candidatus Saccharibacteria bacterium]|nr:oligosaccharide flippase family protein [Candidatus Saccharibacteria bacterium]
MRKKLRFESVVTLVRSELPPRTVAVFLAASALISALLGIFRDRWLNAMYFDTYKAGLDAYTAAFTIPDFMFNLLIAGAISVTFIPVFTQRLKTGNQKSAWELTSSVINLLALVSLAAAVIIFIFAGPIVRSTIGQGFNATTQALTISLMRVVTVNLFLFSISAVVTSVQNSLGRFINFALAPIIYNICIIIGIRVFTGGITIFGFELFDGGIMGVALGVVLGAILQLAVAMIGLFGLGMDYEFKVYWRNQGLRKILRLMPARIADQGLDQLSSVIVNTSLASSMASGTVRSLQQASSLAVMPVNLIGTAISTAFFPQIAQSADEESLFQKRLLAAIRGILWVAIPVATVAFFARGYVVNFIKNGGAPLISALLGILCVTIVSRCLFQIVVRGFYAQQDTKTPFIISLICVTTTILMSLTLVLAFDWGAYGLAFATAAGSLLEVLILLTTLGFRHPGLFPVTFLRAVMRMFAAAFFAAIITYSMVRFFPLRATDDSFWITFPRFSLIAGSGLLTYFIACYFLNLDDVKPILNQAKRILFRNAK